MVPIEPAEAPLDFYTKAVQNEVLVPPAEACPQSIRLFRNVDGRLCSVPQLSLELSLLSNKNLHAVFALDMCREDPLIGGHDLGRFRGDEKPTVHDSAAVLFATSAGALAAEGSQRAMTQYLLQELRPERSIVETYSAMKAHPQQKFELRLVVDEKGDGFPSLGITAQGTSESAAR
jgi:hypothetical protein